MTIMSLVETCVRPRNMALLVMAACIGSLAFAYTAQYAFNLQPCILCLYQRKPYFAALALALLALLVQKHARAFLLLCALSFLTGSGIAGYHVGVEQGWWQGTASCGGGNLPVGATLEQLQEYLRNQPVVRCDVPAWTFMGLSMTAYNLLFSTGLAAATLLGLRMNAKP